MNQPTKASTPPPPATWRGAEGAKAGEELCSAPVTRPAPVGSPTDRPEIPAGYPARSVGTPGPETCATGVSGPVPNPVRPEGNPRP